MKKVLVCAALVLLSLLLTACTSEPIDEQPDETAAGAAAQAPEEPYEEEPCEEPYEETNNDYIDDTCVYAADDIPVKIPFTPIPGNVVMLSHTFRETLIFTDCSIWKIPDAVYNFSKPVRMMDTIDNIKWSIENTHIMTTDNTLYFLDFEHGQAVQQLENVTSTYHWHIGTFLNPLRYVRTADGAGWGVDEAQPIRLPDDYTFWCNMPRGETTILDIVSADQWFDYDVRYAWCSFVLTEDNVLWEFDSWENDAVPSVIKEDVKSLYWDFIITTDNVLWQLPPWDNEEADFRKVMENVRLFDNWLIITTDNELWGYRDGEPFKIMDNVQSVPGRFGFITLDNTLWWLPDWGRTGREYQPPVRVKENVSHTWWNWSSEYIITTDGSLWLFNYEDKYLVQVFQAVP